MAARANNDANELSCQACAAGSVANRGRMQWFLPEARLKNDRADADFVVRFVPLPAVICVD
jgi:hypothetical protein